MVEMVEAPVATAETHYFDQAPLDRVPTADADRRRAAIRGFFAGGGFPYRGPGGLAFLRSRRPEAHPLAPPGAGAAPAKRPDGLPNSNTACCSREGAVLTSDVQHDGFACGELELGDADRLAKLEGSGTGVNPSEPQPLEMLNAGLFDCGFRVRLAAGREAGPVLLYSRRQDDGEPAMRHPRSLIELDPGSRLTVVEVHDGESATPGWTNSSTLCRLGEDAELRYVRVEMETGNIAHTGRVTFRLGRNARVQSTVLSLTGGKSRTDTAAVLTTEGAEVDLDGLFLGVERARADQHTLVVHSARHTASRQLVKNVLSDEATAVFDGKVVVAPGAAGTDASQANRNLLLSTKAVVHTRPRLEINNDDVKCAHGAAIGRLDPDALFYLRSRGLGRRDSHEILVRGFAGEVVEKIPVEAVRALAGAGLQRVRESRSFAA